jgi:predicted MFS family arabinose efflux permease
MGRATLRRPTETIDGRTMRTSIWIGVLVGSTVGGLVPELWGDSMLSYAGVLLSGIGAFVGLWIGAKAAR